MTDISGTLATVQYLRQNGLSSLIEKYKVGTRQHKEYPNLIQFKYDQIKSPMETDVVQECRGLILDSKDNWKVICLPYKKFFNWNESNAAKIDWNSARVYEKLDGSLATMYWYAGKWNVCSSGLPDGSGITFAELFWEIFKKNNMKLPTETNICYMFEMITPRNIIIVRPNREAVVLHGARDMSTFQELDPVPIGAALKWEVVPIYPLKSQDEILNASKKLNPVSCEGYVVVDKDFNRVKVKSPAYVALAHLSVKNALGLNNRFMLQIVRIHEDDEFLAYYPKYTRLHKVVKAKYDQLCKKITDLYDSIQNQLKENPDTTYWAVMHKATQSEIYRDILTKMFVNKIDVKTYCQLTDIAVLSKYVEAETVQIWNGSEKETEQDEKSLYEEVAGIVMPLSKSDKKKKKKGLKVPTKGQGFEIDDVSLVQGAKKDPALNNNNNNNDSNDNNITPKEPKPKPKQPSTSSSATAKSKKKTDEDLDELIAHFKKLDELAQQQKDQQEKEDMDTPTRASKKKSKKKK